MRTLAALFLAVPLLSAVSLFAAEPGKLTENVATRANPRQSYTLYLPPDYDGVKRHPAIIVMDPGGNGTAVAELFRPAAEEYGWIILSTNGARSGDGPANEATAQAIVPELNHYPVTRGRVYVAGFSGTAALAWQIGLATNVLHGVISTGGRNLREIPPARFTFAHYGFAGHVDFNNREMREVDALLEDAKKMHRFEDFPGEHRWFTREHALDAFGWMEVLAMRDGLRPKDEALIEKLRTKDLAAAAALESAGKKLEAFRRYRAIAATYDDASARAAVARLDKDSVVARERKEEATWDEFERTYDKHVLGTIRALFARMREDEMPATEARLARELRVPDLQRRAARGGREGLAAQRMLNLLYTHSTFRLIDELFAQREYSLAAMLLGVAAQIHPDRWHPWYNQATAYARSGNAKAALTSLEKAVSVGFRNAKQLAADEDFATLRETERYQALLAKLQ